MKVRTLHCNQTGAESVTTEGWDRYKRNINGRGGIEIGEIGHDVDNVFTFKKKIILVLEEYVFLSPIPIDYWPDYHSTCCRH